MHNRLPNLPPTLRMILDPLIRPLHRLPPPIRVTMESSKINILQPQLLLKITPIPTIIELVAQTGDIEAALAARGHEVVAVDGLDVRGHLVGPVGQEFRGAFCGAGEVADGVGTAAGLVA